MNYFSTFNPAILLGDRLGLTLYGMFVEAYLSGNNKIEQALYSKFIRHFPRESKEHTPAHFAELIESVRISGLDPFRPIYANPDEYSMIQGSHRCSIAIQMGIREVPFNLRFQDDRADNSVFYKIFSPTEMDLIQRKRDEYIDRCDPDTALRCRIRKLMRQGESSFRAPFSSRTKIPTLRTYQALEVLGISGKRPSKRRLEIYELRKYLHPEMIALEIGCNVGFFTLTISPYLQRIDAFDIDANFIDLAEVVRSHCGIDNCHFSRKSLKDFIPSARYGLVVSTAVHGWSGLSFSEFIALIDNALLPGGILLFESHELDAEKDWDKKRTALQTKFEFLESGLIDDVDKSMYASEMREFLILRKPDTVEAGNR